MGWLITAGILLLIGILPVGIRGRYDADGPFAWLLIGPAAIRLYPQKAKKKEEKPKAQKPAHKKKSQKPAAPKEKSKEETGGSVTEFLPLVQTVLELLGGFRRKLRVIRLEMKLVMAADDPCDLAVNYGRAWAALGNLMPQLERLFVIKKRDLQVECDFTAEKTLVTARLDLTITIGRLLGLLTVYGFRLLRQYLAIMKSRKGGAKP